MANRSVLGLYHEATSTADTIERLLEMGVPDEAITVMSGVPYTPEMLGRIRKNQLVTKVVPERIIITSHVFRERGQHLKQIWEAQ